MNPEQPKVNGFTSSSIFTRPQWHKISLGSLTKSCLLVQPSLHVCIWAVVASFMSILLWVITEGCPCPERKMKFRLMSSSSHAQDFFFSYKFIHPHFRNSPIVRYSNEVGSISLSVIHYYVFPVDVWICTLSLLTRGDVDAACRGFTLHTMVFYSPRCNHYNHRSHCAHLFPGLCLPMFMLDQIFPFTSVFSESKQAFFIFQFQCCTRRPQ